MLGTAQAPSTRTVFKRLAFVRPAILALLGALAFAASAQADPLMEQGPEAPASYPLAEQAEVPAGEQGAQAPAPEQAPETPGSEPVTEQAPQAPAPETVAPETPAPEAPAPETPAPETPAPEAPAPEPVVEPAPPPPAPEPVGEQAPEALAAETLKTPQGPEGGVQSSSPSASQSVVAASGAAGEAAPEGPSVLVASPTGYVVIDLGETVADSGASAISLSGPEHVTAAQVPGRLSCELSSLGGPSTLKCAAGWLGTQSLLATPATGFVAADASLATAAGASGSNDPGSSEGGGRPVLPSPGPAPSGASGGAAAGGAGVGLSGFLTRAGRLRLAAPRAMRRLRLSCQPWRTAFFVLIPERPG